MVNQESDRDSVLPALDPVGEEHPDERGPDPSERILPGRIIRARRK
jgi:hypothetical protein